LASYGVRGRNKAVRVGTVGGRVAGYAFHFSELAEETGEGEYVVLNGTCPTTDASRCQRIAGIRPDRFFAWDATPVIVGYGMGELALDRVFGGEARFDFAAENVVRFLLFGSGDVAGTGRQEGIAAIGRDLFFSGHMGAPARFTFIAEGEGTAQSGIALQEAGRATRFGSLPGASGSFCGNLAA
jgi:hypothetical protein